MKHLLIAFFPNGDVVKGRNICYITGAMWKQLTTTLWLGFIITSGSIMAINANSSEMAPNGLRVDLLENTDLVWQNGYTLNLPLETAIRSKGKYQFATIQSSKPAFSWALQGDAENVLQTAYQIRVATTSALLSEGKPDLWDSDQITSDHATGVPYDGKPLEPGKVYYWQVRSWNNGEASPFSTPKAFVTAEQFSGDYGASHYPLQKTDEFPIIAEKSNTAEGSLQFFDFGRAAFGTLRITATTANENESLTIRLGERATGKRVNHNPGGTIRYAEYTLALTPGTHTYRLQLRPDKRNTGNQAIKMPDYIGEVFPFRYCEIETKAPVFEVVNIVRESVFYPFSDTGKFSCDNQILNQIWELCRYSMKMTSFCGVYVDGDRERIPYEADALINQLSHYATDNEYSLARVSSEYLIHNATWPTEWILQSVLIAWNDYLYTGDPHSIRACYTDLKAKTLLPLADEKTHLISTKTGLQTPELVKSVHYYNGKELRDIVDWPQGGDFGQGGKPGESDYFVFKDYNTVVNAYHYRALQLMESIASTLGETADASFFHARAAEVLASFNEHFFNAETSTYRDGIGTDHSALHSNMFPMAFGMVPDKQRDSVMTFIRSRGMACSVYGSQFLMDAIYDGNDATYGLTRLITEDDRGWYNMIRLGSTVTLEAWDNKYKSNLDWNHAWGAAPANIIMRKLVGVEPLTAGFGTIRIKPQPGTLKQFTASVPSIRGTIGVAINRDDTSFSLSVNIPAGILAEVWIPSGEILNPTLSLNGHSVNYQTENGFLVISNVGSGSKRFLIK